MALRVAEGENRRRTEALREGPVKVSSKSYSLPCFFSRGSFLRPCETRRGTKRGENSPDLKEVLFQDCQRGTIIAARFYGK